MLRKIVTRGCVTLAAVLIASIIGCGGDGHLRGYLTESPDGNTYLAIVDDNNGCEIKVDGQDWNAALGDPEPVQPGEHVIACGGGEIHFIIPEGVVFNFDYWGP